MQLNLAESKLRPLTIRAPQAGAPYDPYRSDVI